MSLATRTPCRMPRTFRAHVTPESLERRQLLSAAPSSTSVDGHWEVRGTPRADVIVVAPSPEDAATLRVSVNGAAVGTHPLAGLASLEVFAGAGGDAVTVDLGDAATGAGVSVTVHGERGRDRLTGGATTDTLEGGPGADVLTGNGGGDTLEGGPGNDVLTGGAGADTLRGGRGRDRFFRQGGVDATSTDARDRVAADAVGALTRLETDDALRAWVVDAAVRQYAWAFGQNATGWLFTTDPIGAVHTSAFAGAEAATPGAAAPDAASGAAGSGYSKTNVQTEGVDEADLVETDGNLLYTLRHPDFDPTAPTPGEPGVPQPVAPSGDELVIADVEPADGMSVSSRTSVEGWAVGMYLVGTRLAVVSMLPDYGVVVYNDGVPLRFAAPSGVSIIEPGQPKVKVTVFDVTDATAPALVEETWLEGSYGDSRAVGDRVYVVLHNDTWPPAPRLEPDPDGSGQVYESEASYRARLETAPLSELLPTYSSKAGGAETSGALVAAPSVYVKDTAAPSFGQNMSTVAVLNVGDAAGGPAGSTSVAGWAGTVYVSPHAAYVAGTFFDGFETVNEPRTNLFKFELQPDAVPLVATGEVDGWLPSQFAMDEDAGGRLRVATTSGGNFSPVARNSNGVYVLAQDGTDLKTVGSVTGIADGEHLTSARFVGDSAYLVTFRQVDPLFSVDLADPEHPKVAGELKVPGFSSYLHPAADGLLLGLGRDADEAGRITGLQLSLFDVSRPSRPVRVDAEAIDLGGAYSNSAAEYDHHAFAYFPESQVVAVPVDAYNFEGAGSHRVVVFKVSKGQGLVPLGEVSLDENASRTFRIGGVLYVVSQNTVKAVTVDDPTVQVGLLDLRDKS